MASPWLPVELLIVTMAGFDELQITEVVRSETVPFLKKPVAANCCLSPKGIEGFVGDREIEASPETEPVPERLDAWGLVAAVSVTKSWPVLVPTAVGVNVILTVHECPGNSVEPQLLLWAKSPVVVMLKIVNAVLKRLVTVTALGPLATPTICVPRFKLLGERSTGEVPAYTPEAARESAINLAEAFHFLLSLIGCLRSPEQFGHVAFCLPTVRRYRFNGNLRRREDIVGTLVPISQQFAR